MIVTVQAGQEAECGECGKHISKDDSIVVLLGEWLCLDCGQG